MMIYHYSGLNNVRVWAQSINSFNQTNTDPSNALLTSLAANYKSAPQLFINGTESFVAFNQSYVPGYLVTPTGWPIPAGESGIQNFVSVNQTLMPYHIASSTSYPVMSGSVLNNINISACNPYTVRNIPGYNLYWCTPNGALGANTLGKVGTTYLMCGNWSTAGMQTGTPDDTTYNTAVKYSQAASWADNTGYFANIVYGNYYCSSNANNNGQEINYDTIGDCEIPTDGSANMTVMGITNYENFSSWKTGFSAFSEATPISAGGVYKTLQIGFTGMPSSFSGTYIPLAMQITMNDGFYAPILLHWLMNGIGATDGSIPNTVGVGYNLNANIVQIENQNINQTESTLTFTSFPWSPLFLPDGVVHSGTNPQWATPSAINVNGNLIMPYGISFPNATITANEYNQYENSILAIGVNPMLSSCVGYWFYNTTVFSDKEYGAMEGIYNCQFQ